MNAFKKRVTVIAVLLCMAGIVVAQEDFGGFDGFGDFGSDFGDFGNSGGDAASPALTFSGTAEAYGRVFLRRDNADYDTHHYDATALQDKATKADVAFTLGANYAGASTDFDVTLACNRLLLTDYREDILQELTARVYLGNFQLEAGKLKLVWGKGDKLHVLDNFNANDYTDFIVPDYIDRRIAEPMFHLVYNAPFNARFEGVFTPWMTADRLASSGMWKPAAVAELTDTVTQMFTDYALAQTNTQAASTALLSASSFDADDLYPNTRRLKYAQGGLRSTFTLGSVDLGASYYYGHYKQPSAKLKNAIVFKALNYGLNADGSVSDTYATDTTKTAAYALAQKKYYAGAYAQAIAAGADAATAAATAESYVSAKTAEITAAVTNMRAAYKVRTSLPTLDYDQLQVFGLEAATVIGPFNTRAELAYNLTKDVAGDNPWVKNNSIAWELGFDLDLPIHNVNLNLQTTGTYILHKNNIKNGGINVENLGTVSWETLGANYDVDYDPTGAYSRNQLVIDVTDTFRNEKIKLDVKGIYQFETKDLMILPSVRFRLGTDDFTLSLSGLYIWCKDEDSEYYEWRNNDFLAVGITYQF